MKKLLLLTTAAMLAFPAFAQDYPYAQDYFYISDSNWTLMTQFPQEGEGTLNVYFNGLTYKTEDGGDRQYTTVGDMKGPFFGTSNSKNSFYTDESGNNVCIAFQNQNTGFSYTYSKSSVTNAINVASIDYSTKKITLSKAENIELTINGITPFVSPIALQAPEGVLVYEYDSYSNGELVVKLVKNGQIQSNIPVILKSEESKSYVFDFVNENFYDYSDVVKIQNPSQGKPVYFPDVNTGIIYGVQSPHFLSVGSYEFINEQFTKVETKNTALVNSFSCYLQLPEDTETNPESISIVFPEEEQQDDITVNLGPDITNQSGTIEDNYIKITTVGDGALVFVEVGAGVDAIYYYIAEEEVDVKGGAEEDLPSGSYAGKRRALPEGASYTEAKVRDGVATIGLVVGSGQLHIATSADGDNEQVFTYTVAKGVPTAVEAIETAADENGAIYNIFGQKVDASYKGIVIKNGKKFIQR